MRRFCGIAKSARDLHLFWRDQFSYDVALKNFDCNNYLCPDMAHFLWPLNVHGNGSKTMFLMRQDQERGAVPDWVQKEQSRFIDWRDLIPIAHRQMPRMIKGLDIAGDLARIGVPSLDLWAAHSWMLMRRMTRIFADYELVVTSRLHAHIFACLMKRRSLIIDNCYGKNSRYFNLWTRETGLGELADNK